LYKGTWFHKAMEAHYNTIRLAQLSKEKPQLAECRFQVEETLAKCHPEIAPLIWWMYEGYVNHYGTDDDWRILAVEHSSQVSLRTPAGRKSRFIIKLKIDLIVKVKSTRNILVVDHKSGKDLPKKKMLELDDQFGLYTWGLRQMGKRVFGQLYNAARTLRLQGDIAEPGTQPLDERFSRIRMYRTDKELTQVALEAYLTAKQRYDQQREMNAAGIHSPRHTNPQDCNWKCDFTEPCIAGRKGMDLTRYLRDAGFRQDFTRH
jgi:hypothetical protein